MNTLIEQVKAIDAEAAEWLLTEAPKLDSFTTSDDLREVMTWDDTPQGHRYWENIANQLVPNAPKASGLNELLDWPGEERR